MTLLPINLREETRSLGSGCNYDQYLLAVLHITDGTVKILAENSAACIDTSENVLETLNVSSWKWRMKINCEKNKTEVICFNTSEGDMNLIPTSFKIGGKIIYRVPETKVLGLTIDENLTYKSHCQNVIKSLQGRWASLCKYSNKYWGLNYIS